ncbi:MAG: cytochrome c [Rhodobacteraceae bacterium]|nr:cytochrome c [Paracoccaceae bacterium]
MRLAAPLAIAALLTVGIAPALASEAAVEARQAQFKLLAFNLGTVGAMVQGSAPYEAATAQQAAENLAQLASLHQAPMWPAGTDSASMEGTRALPGIWEDADTFAERFEALGTRSAALTEVAGDGLDSLRAGLGPVIQACSACHQDFRAPR